MDDQLLCPDALFNREPLEHFRKLFYICIQKQSKIRFDESGKLGKLFFISDSCTLSNAKQLILLSALRMLRFANKILMNFGEKIQTKFKI